MSLSFCIIGAGNLATHLAKSLNSHGFSISQIYSRTVSSAKALADELNTSYTTSLNNIDPSADIFIVAIKDSAFDGVLPKINFNNKLLVHCSGSTPLSVLEKYSKNYGVFYPLQTFSRNRNVDFASIPIFIESNSNDNEKKLIEIARGISNTVSVLDSEKRLNLHISAVFACNFVNHLYTISSEILKSCGIPFDVLKPLIVETALKVQEIQPVLAQTGPAIRFDEKIISLHLERLSENNDYRELYNSISKSIFAHHK